MHEAGNSAVDHKLFFDVYIHVCDRPVHILGVNSADFSPVVGVLSVEQNNLRLT